MSQIETINVIPTIEEASQFLTSAEDEETQIKLMEELLSQLNQSQQVVRQFAKGDKVKVITGELQNLIGSVVSQSGNQVQVAPAFLGMNKDILNFHSSEIQKFFVEGDSVQFLQGKFKGCEGKIVSVEGEVVTVYLFEEGKYVNGLLANIQLVGLNQSNGEQTKQPKQDLRKYDLIRSISDRKPCVILRIVNNFITAIDENNDMLSLNLMQIDEKLNNFRAVCLNRYHQKIIIDCSVRVVSGVNAGKSAIVKQIYQDIIFLYNEEFQRTFGIFVEKADNLYLVSSFSFQKQFRKRLNYSNNKAINEDENEKPKPKKFQPGQFIIIQKGDWKGHQGIIVECDEKIARVELQSKYKIVIVPIKFLLEDQFEGMDEIVTQPFGLQQPEQGTWGKNVAEPETNGALWGHNTEVQNNVQPEWGNTIEVDNNAQPDWNNNNEGNANQSNNVKENQNGQENDNFEIGKKEEIWGEQQQQGQQIEQEAAW